MPVGCEGNDALIASAAGSYTDRQLDMTVSKRAQARAVSESLKYAAEQYRNQPGRIENYEPGKSSIAEKEAKQWWDEVLDIFDGFHF
ncbi:hypothetical protein FOCC_FOCC001533 [Frankliniella occidentalis]|nr:hypothetical protein FOCC_FOCC001533 [Frankliniella occidentalis]